MNKAVDVYTEVRDALGKLTALEQNQKHIAEMIEKLDRRLHSLECDQARDRAEISKDAMKAASEAAHSSMGVLMDRLMYMSTRIDEIEMGRLDVGARRSMPSPKKGANGASMSLEKKDSTT